MIRSDLAIFNHPQAIQTENRPKIGIRPTIDGWRRCVENSSRTERGKHSVLETTPATTIVPAPTLT
jgi:hypothetical protein